jgi:predicted transcriptional regulator
MNRKQIKAIRRRNRKQKLINIKREIRRYNQSKKRPISHTLSFPVREITRLNGIPRIYYRWEINK